ncbi:MAG: cation diffusion facilitator family transporter [Myxococcota bacterium]|nr:cation diffusion facilitator family transporter [Myxococcota bacterium]
MRDKAKKILTTQSKQVRRAVLIGLAINLFLSLVKFIGGVWGSSQAVVADAIHSLSDCVTDVAILIGVNFWTKPPDADHPYGHRRIETVVTVFIGLSLAAVAFGIVADAVSSFAEPGRHPPGNVALIAALISVATKEVLYRWTKKAGTRTQSPALIANAWHHRSDAMSSIPAVITVGLSRVDPSLTFLDGIGALLVSMFILYAAWQIVMPGLAQLTDKGATAEEIEKIQRIVQRIDSVRDVHQIRSRFSGLGLHVDLHILVDGDLSVRKGHAIAEIAKTQLMKEIPSIVDVVSHIEPVEENSGLTSIPPCDDDAP